MDELMSKAMKKILSSPSLTGISSTGTPEAGKFDIDSQVKTSIGCRSKSILSYSRESTSFHRLRHQILQSIKYRKPNPMAPTYVEYKHDGSSNVQDSYPVDEAPTNQLTSSPICCSSDEDNLLSTPMPSLQGLCNSASALDDVKHASSSETCVLTAEEPEKALNNNQPLLVSDAKTSVDIDHQKNGLNFSTIDRNTDRMGNFPTLKSSISQNSENMVERAVSINRAVGDFNSLSTYSFSSRFSSQCTTNPDIELQTSSVNKLTEQSDLNSLDNSMIESVPPQLLQPSELVDCENNPRLEMDNSTTFATNDVPESNTLGPNNRTLSAENYAESIKTRKRTKSSRRRSRRSKSLPTFKCSTCNVSYLISSKKVLDISRCFHCDFWTIEEPMFMQEEKQDSNFCQIS